LDYVPDADLAGLYSGAALFAFPSLYEGFGFPVLEAMACHTPVVCANSSSLPELAGDAALLVKLNRVVLLAPALLLLSATTRPARASGTAPVGTAPFGGAPFGGAPAGQARLGALAGRSPVPPFVLGFLALGTVVSVGWVPPAAADLLATGGTLATAAAMAGLGFGIDAGAVRRDGGGAVATGTASFLVLTALAVPAFLIIAF
ncbi:MAG: putative sulfate exporter family transporter, partial [Trueperaceae bacterium]